MIPRAHDCITFFFKSRKCFQEYFDEHPGTYYKTYGWTERDAYGDGDKYATPAYGKRGVMGKLGLSESDEKLVEEYGEENAAFIAESMGNWTVNYSRFTYLKMGICDETAFIEAVRRQAAENGWEFELQEGNMCLLEKLLLGQWDEDFIIVHPGE